MSTSVQKIKDQVQGKDLHITAFSGAKRGQCLQLDQSTVDGVQSANQFQVIQINKAMAEQLRDFLNDWLDD